MRGKVIKLKKEENNVDPKRFKILLLFIIFIFVIIIGRLIFIQFIQGKELQEKAHRQQSKNTEITPKRGTIYDSTGKTLAVSASVDTVTINPKRLTEKITEEKKQLMAEKFATLFEIEVAKVIEILNSDSTAKVIAKKIEKVKTDELVKWLEENEIKTGVTIEEDNKRFYPYDNLASNLIGFVGSDNQGLSGLESKWDSILKGTSGKIVTAKDGVGEEIPGTEQMYIPEENGSDLVLTIDAKIQNIAEKYLKQAIAEYDVKKGGSVIIMNPKNGDILAMATYPDYNLNTPFEPNTEALKKNWDTNTDVEKNNILQKMWRNTPVTDTYEPGSTFKLITTAIAIEENLITTDKTGDFICTGKQVVADREIKCWRWERPHGSQSLRQILQNSCNPGFVQLGQKIGANLFYKYFEAFGFFERTGDSFQGEATGIFHEETKVKSTELATMSFGQRFNITPLQLITSVSSIVNGGNLMQPRIVKEIKNNDTGATTEVEQVEVRKVVSKTTTDVLLDLMESVVVDGTGKNAAVKGYSIGGKSGTSEAAIGREKEDGFIASFVGVGPTENPEVVVLVTLSKPGGDIRQGGQTAGPTVSKILTEVLPYLEIPTEGNGQVSTNTLAYEVVPDVKNKTATEAEKLLKTKGFNIQTYISDSKDKSIITEQVPKPGTLIPKDSHIIIYDNIVDTRVSAQVPNLIGMSLAQAKNALKAKKMNVVFEGNGKVVSQDPSPTQNVEEGTVVKIVLSELSGNAH